MAAAKSRPARWRLSQDLRDQLSQAGSQLDDELAQLQGWRENASETWRQSDEGNLVLAWFEDLNQLAHLLENLDAQVPAQAD